MPVMLEVRGNKRKAPDSSSSEGPSERISKVRMEIKYLTRDGMELEAELDRMKKAHREVQPSPKHLTAELCLTEMIQTSETNAELTAKNDHFEAEKAALSRNLRSTTDYIGSQDAEITRLKGELALEKAEHEKVPPCYSAILAYFLLTRHI